MLHRHGLLALGMVVATLASGCGQGETAVQVDPQVVAEHRARFLLSEEPQGAQGIMELAEGELAADEAVLVGLIGGVPEPWTAGKASFIMADPAAMLDLEAEGHEGCSGDGCPFCSKKKDKATAGLAVVRFEDGSGNLLPLDARQLFDLAEKTMVVVRGKVRRDELGYVVVAADGLYIRR